MLSTPVHVFRACENLRAVMDSYAFRRRGSNPPLALHFAQGIDSGDRHSGRDPRQGNGGAAPMLGVIGTSCTRWHDVVRAPTNRWARPTSAPPRALESRQVEGDLELPADAAEPVDHLRV